MLRRLTLALALLVVAAPTATPQTADDIVARIVAAHGGLEKLKAVQTRRLTATMSLSPQGLEAPVVIEAKRPDKLRETVTVQGVDNIEAYDGETAWMLAPARNMPTAQRAPAGELRDLRHDADFDGPLVDYQAKGTAIELMGKEPVQGADAWKLKLTLKDGDVRYLYVDAQRYLPIKVQATRDINGAPVNTETATGDYRDEAGLMVAHTLETTTQLQGMTITQKLVIQKVEINVPIEDVRFTMPVPKVAK